MGSEGEDRPPLDDVFRLVASERRRWAIACLLEHDSPIALADLADEVAVREYGVVLSEISEEDVLDVYLSLYHKHVPKLDAAGLVTYSQDRDMVRVSADADRIRPLLFPLLDRETNHTLPPGDEREDE